MSTLEYIQLRDSLLMKLLKTKDVTLLEKIEDLFNNNEKEDFFDELPKEIQNDILESIEESKKGLGRPIEDVINELR